MNYLTNYYKNLCEQLQQQINLLESGLRKAQGHKASHETKHKELLRQLSRIKLRGKNEIGTSDIQKNVEELTTGDEPKKEFWTGHVEKVMGGSQKEAKQQPAKKEGPVPFVPFPSPSQMARSFMMRDERKK